MLHLVVPVAAMVMVLAQPANKHNIPRQVRASAFVFGVAVNNLSYTALVA